MLDLFFLIAGANEKHAFRQPPAGATLPALCWGSSASHLQAHFRQPPIGASPPALRWGWDLITRYPLA